MLQVNSIILLKIILKSVDTYKKKKYSKCKNKVNKTIIIQYQLLLI